MSSIETPVFRDPVIACGSKSFEVYVVVVPRDDPRFRRHSNAVTRTASNAAPTADPIAAPASIPVDVSFEQLYVRPLGVVKLLSTLAGQDRVVVRTLVCNCVWSGGHWPVEPAATGTCTVMVDTSVTVTRAGQEVGASLPSWVAEAPIPKTDVLAEGVLEVFDASLGEPAFAESDILGVSERWLAGRRNAREIICAENYSSPWVGSALTFFASAGGLCCTSTDICLSAVTRRWSASYTAAASQVHVLREPHDLIEMEARHPPP